MRRGLSIFNVTTIALGLAFLYLPIVILVVYSFNASRLVTVWGGWSARWYIELLNDDAMRDAAWTTLRIGFMSATAATILGTLAAVVLVRSGRFRGRMVFSAFVYAPLVMPEVITGLSLLLLFVAIDIDRGFWTIAIAHTTVTMCFVTVVVQARLLDFDMSLEEAAMDLGCPPLRAFLTVTLPLIFPAIAAGWMLAFTLSLDDLVIASFTTGPGATTLPLRIYSEVRLGVKPEVNAICTIMIAVVAIGVVIAALISKRGDMARARVRSRRAGVSLTLLLRWGGRDRFGRRGHDGRRCHRGGIASRRRRSVAFLTPLDQRTGGLRAFQQALGIEQRERVVPRSGHAKSQIERRWRVIGARDEQARDPAEIEISRRDRR